MTPKAKAKAQELVDKFYWVFGDGYLGDYHKQCALICVEEILHNKGILLIGSRKYWEDVKTEIEKL